MNQHQGRSLRSVAAQLGHRFGRFSGDRRSPAGLAAYVDRPGQRRRDGVRQRIAELTDALAGRRTPADRVWQPSTPDESSHALLERLLATLGQITAAKAWLMLATLDGHLPLDEQVLATVRFAALHGESAALARIVRSSTSAGHRDTAWQPVRVVTGSIMVDVHHTAQTDFATGIQRVTREVTRRWTELHRPMLVGWTANYTALRALSPAEVHRACWGGPPVPVPADDPIVVPWGSTYLLPELGAEPPRAARLQGLARRSGGRFGIIGHDVVPISTAETSPEAMIPAFAAYLAAVRYAAAVATVSAASATEYRGWQSMLAGAGLLGPAVTSVPLPTEAPPEDRTGTAMARSRLVLADLPLVLVVGSHEPRKNHLAVLHAAELLWREGVRFSLTFIGGNSWASDSFEERVAQLQAAGRPVEAITAAGDDLLWGGYRIARFTLFPSINEGFGLPVAESLATGTPVITSNYGSMKEIADGGGGALLVDPRDDHSIAAAMRLLLIDETELARLRAEAVARPKRSWDDYAAATWAVLTGSAQTGSAQTGSGLIESGLIESAVAESALTGST